MAITGQSITLANSIIGVGILAMPFCFQQCGVILATLILIVMGLVSRLCCHFLLKSAIITRRRNFEFLAFHVFGPSGKMAVEVCIIGFLMGTCIAYFVVVGDLGPQIIAKLLNINQSDILRTSIMVIVSLVCVLPLGLLRNVDSLSNVSAATIGFYFCLVIKVITEASSQLLTSDWHTRIEMWKPSGILQCVPIIAMALFCQTQLFEIFESMPSLSLEKMNLVTKNAINICSAVYFTLGIFGYVAFGSKEISGNILMSLSETMASDVIKLGFVMSLAFSFPLIIFPCRASLYSFLYRKAHSSQHDHIINHSIPEAAFRALTVGIVAGALLVSLLVPSVELVLGLAGSTIGAGVCLLFPAACFLRITHKDTSERLLAKVVLVLGLIILVLGTYANLEAVENTRDKYDDKLITQERIDKIVEDFFEKREKAEGVMENPQLVIDTLPKIDINKVNGLIKDSEIQPPNPVPPESNSDEKKPIIKVPELEQNEQDILKQALPQPIQDPVDKKSNSHPKNLQNNLNQEKLSNGAGIVEKPQEKPKESEVKQLANQEKSDMQKQQKLIETIKQHGEEQKELMQEQNKILDEIMKTKQEMQKNKNKKEVVDSDEAKKIAVESIQKIANVAIQSLGGITDKPIDTIIKEKEPILKIADEAVQEIAKIARAADAIKEAKRSEAKVEAKKEQIENQPVFNNVPNAAAVPILNNPPILQSNVGVNAQKINNADTNVNGNINVNAGVNSESKINGNSNINAIPNGNLNSNLNVNAPVNVPSDNHPGNILSNLNSQNIQPAVNKPLESSVNNKPLEKADKPLGHSHSPDEPQSYKRGEDAQKNNDIKQSNNGVPQNVPIPIAMRDNSNNVDTQSVQNGNNQKTGSKNVNNNAIDKINNNFNEVKNGAVDDTHNNNLPIIKLNNNNNLLRQKRDVDCIEKDTVKVKEKQCENEEGSKTPMAKNSDEILNSNMNLNDIGLPNSLPVQQMAIHHMRSLKSYDDNEKSR